MEQKNLQLFQKYQNQRKQIGHGNEKLMMKTKIVLKFLCQEFCSMILQRMTRVNTSKQGWKDGRMKIIRWLSCKVEGNGFFHSIGYVISVDRWPIMSIIIIVIFIIFIIIVIMILMEYPLRLWQLWSFFMINQRYVSFTTNRYFLSPQLIEYNR